MFSNTVIEEVKRISAKGKRLNLSDKSVLITNLVFMQQVIKASERLLVEAAQEATGRLKEYYVSHLEEEREHEKWLSDDLKSEGIDVDKFHIMRLASEMAGSQYYLIKHDDPACLLGYMAVLEGFPFPLDQLESLERLHGKILCKTLRFHAENDLEHRKELFRVIDEVASPAILNSAIQTALYINEFTEQLGSK